MNYYHLIAGLPDLSFEDSKMAFTVEEFKQHLEEILSNSDKKLLCDLFLKYDNDNLLSFLRNKKDAVLNTKGTFSHDEIADAVHVIREEEGVFNKKLPPYFKTFITDFLAGEEALQNLFWEDYLAGLYYDYLGQSKNQFVHGWSELNLNISNVMIALTCRRNGITHVPYIVGNNQVAQNLRTSNARDFELPEYFEQFEQMRRIDEETDLMEKEHKIDRLRWTWIDEGTFFNYFTIERVVGYLFKLQMLERWLDLNEEAGQQKFKEIVGNLKKGALNQKSF
jgi:hypothetical protein